MMARPSVRRFDRMASIRRHDRDHARSHDLHYTIDGHLEFAVDHFIHFFFRMEVLVDRRSASEVIVRECHVR